MSDVDTNMDVRQLVRWLGAEGARAGLEKSKPCTINLLREIAQALKIDVPTKPKRSDLITEIVRVASKRIDKSIDTLYEMDQAELIEYFEHVKVEPPELLDLLKQLDLDPGREGRRNLVEFVARELSETGRFMRIASSENGPSKD